MSLSSGRESKAHIPRIGKKSQDYVYFQLLRVNSLDTKHIESMTASGMLQEENMQCKYGVDRSIFTIHRSFYWWKRNGIVRWEKNALSKSAFYREIEIWNLLVEKETQ